MSSSVLMALKLECLITSLVHRKHSSAIWVQELMLFPRRMSFPKAQSLLYCVHSYFQDCCVVILTTQGSPLHSRVN